MKKFQRPLDIFDSEVLDCVYGQYPWDDWERDALAAGVPKDLAGLGRLTVREAYQHGWDDRLKSLCGWYDQGKRMIRLALRSPATAEFRLVQLFAASSRTAMSLSISCKERTLDAMPRRASSSTIR